MHIEIHIPRPWLTLGLLAAVVWMVYWMHSTSVDQVGAVGEVAAPPLASMNDGSSSDAVGTGGDPMQEHDRLSSDEEQIQRIQIEQNLRERKMDILRAQLAELEAQSKDLGPNATPEDIDAIRQATIQITSLMQDANAADQELVGYFREVWDAEGRASELSKAGFNPNVPISALIWPVDPSGGITAMFHDAAYKKFFGYEHNAIDIRALKGTIVRAAQTGIVREAFMDGARFSHLTIQGENGVSTLYGHMDQFFVQVGDKVTQGQDIGRSNGARGEVGSGNSTGQHLHFAVFANGKPVDPLNYLPDGDSYKPQGQE